MKLPNFAVFALLGAILWGLAFSPPAPARPPEVGAQVRHAVRCEAVDTAPAVGVSFAVLQVSQPINFPAPADTCASPPVNACATVSLGAPRFYWRPDPVPNYPSICVQPRSFHAERHLLG